MNDNLLMKKANKYARKKDAYIEIWNGKMVVTLYFDNLGDATEAALKIKSSKSVEGISIFDADGRFKGGIDGAGS